MVVLFLLCLASSACISLHISNQVPLCCYPCTPCTVTCTKPLPNSAASTARRPNLYFISRVDYSRVAVVSYRRVLLVPVLRTKGTSSGWVGVVFCACDLLDFLLLCASSSNPLVDSSSSSSPTTLSLQPILLSTSFLLYPFPPFSPIPFSAALILFSSITSPSFIPSPHPCFIYRIVLVSIAHLSTKLPRFALFVPVPLRITFDSPPVTAYQ